jgi:flagellar protein FlaG
MDTSLKINGLDPLAQALAAVAGAASSNSTAGAGAAASARAPAIAKPEAVAVAVAPTPSKADLKNSVDAINRFLQVNSEVHFSIDEDSGQSVVKVIDTETKKVLRQFPSEQSLEIGKNLSSLKGLLIDSKA